MSSSSSSSPPSSSSSRHFGPYPLLESQVFYESASKQTQAFVNLGPIVPGHVLVTPRRVVARMAQLSHEEVTDLWLSVHHIGPIIEKKFGCSSLNLAIQDGVESGQSVPHVHVHILPRRAGDFKRNDDIYELLDEIRLDKELDASSEATSAVDPTRERVPRTAEDMANEARELMELFPDNQPSRIQD